MRVGRKRNQKITLPTVHDRRSTDLTRGHIEMAVEEVDDPYEAGAKIIVMRSLRDDPLQRLFCRQQINEAQYEGGNAWREDWEAVERGPKAIDPTKEAVDGGKLPEPITERQRKAAIRLNRAAGELGQSGSAIVISVLVHGQTMCQIAEGRGLSGRRWEENLAMQFQKALTTLSVVYGFAMRSRFDTIS